MVSWNHFKLDPPLHGNQNKQKEVRGHTTEMRSKKKKNEKKNKPTEKTKKVPFYSILRENAHTENIINLEDIVLRKNKTTELQIVIKHHVPIDHC